jgi:urease accessory protein
MLTELSREAGRHWLSRTAQLAVGTIIATLLINPAYAHEEVGGGAGFLTGLLHPALGFDHLLAMLSVGILSVQIGGRAIWHVPATFVLIMIVGGFLGIKGVGIPMVEAGIAISVLILGAALAADKLIPEWVAVISVAVFGTFHGHAHGTEMPLIANPWLYGLGFVTGTSIIHLMGVSLGFGFRRWRRGPGLLRAAGVCIAGVGCFFLIAARGLA